MASEHILTLKRVEIKYSLAEQYSYIMLDEFQDTNPAQFRLVESLTDHPVHEGRPNVLAVGDDDQAIYAFQGAEQGNMAGFAIVAWSVDGGISSSIRVRDSRQVGRGMVPDFVRSQLIEHLATD